MRVRGFLVVLALALAASAGWFFYVRQGTIDLNGTTVSRDITPPGSVEARRDGGLPRFDIVRIDRSGRAVISGHAPPGSQVTLLSGERPIGDVSANERGEWVIIADKPLRGSSEITLSARARDGSVSASAETVITHVPKAAGMPLAIIERRNGPSHILQRPDELGDAALAVEVVDHVEGGGLYVSGRSTPRTAVRIYIDNDPGGFVRADSQGEWTLKLDEIAPGAYTMRVDQLGPKGAVAARIEVPFERADPDLVASQMLRSGPLGLEADAAQWRIARRAGTSLRLTVIYPASRGQARDPNLIYPGQIFEQPEASLEK